MQSFLASPNKEVPLSYHRSSGHHLRVLSNPLRQGLPNAHYWGPGVSQPTGQRNCDRIITAHQRSFVKIMFLVMSVCPQGESHVNITHDALRITVQGPLPPSPSQGHPALGPLLLTPGGQYWRDVQTCSLKDDIPPPTDTYWQLKKQV